MPHSFSVEEIQKGRSLLKSSKSYPDDFLKKANEGDIAALEDGDNSSSGVSSDQEVPAGVSTDFTDNTSNNVTVTANSKVQRPQIGKF